MPESTLFNPETIQKRLAQPGSLVKPIRQLLFDAKPLLEKEVDSDLDISEVLKKYSRLMDQILIALWRKYEKELIGCCLLAIGGYGREEMLPHSDIDIMLLIPEKQQNCADCTQSIESFLTTLWDVNLIIGHSVRNLKECITLAAEDVTIITSLMESRLLIGDKPLYREMTEAIKPEKMWPSNVFFRAKREEELARHQKYSRTAYNLEPDIKNGPGGLRSLQMLIWIAKRHFSIDTLHALISKDLLSTEDYQAIKDGKKFLLELRFALHTIAGRNENRLLFDYQKELAKYFNYQDNRNALAIEQLMKHYYRTIKSLLALSEMLRQLLGETILYSEQVQIPELIDEQFQIYNKMIKTVDDEVFKRNPSALFELFLVMAKNPKIQVIHATTLHQLHKYRYLIDKGFRNNSKNQRLFMEILSQKNNIFPLLERMNLHGLLARYLPEFGQIVGQVQYDLVHVYTVDQHTLFLINNLCRFRDGSIEERFPLCTKIMAKIAKPELVLIAAFYHDIAKGREGDHSELGAIDAANFCKQHGLDEEDEKLVCWLVENHLIMSVTAQKMDISEPDVINAFAHKVHNQTYLNYLYLLTIADIRATNRGLWNGWKNTLFQKLYYSTKQALPRLLANPITRNEIIAENKKKAEQLLSEKGILQEKYNTLWQQLTDTYFLHETPERIVRQTEAIITHGDQKTTLVQLSNQNEKISTEILTYCKNRYYLFATTTAILDREGLNIVDARITLTKQGYCLSSFIVLDRDGKAIENPYQLAHLKLSLIEKLDSITSAPVLKKRLSSRRLRHFTYPTQIKFSNVANDSHTAMEIITPDRPGLLAQISKIFVNCEIRLLGAKIATLGERVEDVFFISTLDKKPLNDPEKREKLKKNICQVLDGL